MLGDWTTCPLVSYSEDHPRTPVRMKVSWIGGKPFSQSFIDRECLVWLLGAKNYEIQRLLLFFINDHSFIVNIC